MTPASGGTISDLDNIVRAIASVSVQARYPE
jgi:hypothetical protein